jgi:hypothetical protein
MHQMTVRPGWHSTTIVYEFLCIGRYAVIATYGAVRPHRITTSVNELDTYACMTRPSEGHTHNDCIHLQWSPSKLCGWNVRTLQVARAVPAACTSAGTVSERILRSGHKALRCFDSGF